MGTIEHGGVRALLVTMSVRCAAHAVAFGCVAQNAPKTVFRPESAAWGSLRRSPKTLKSAWEKDARKDAQGPKLA